MASFYSSIPTLENLKQNDVIFYNTANNVNFQSPQIQELFKQGAIQGYQDPLHPEKGDVGVKLIKPYVNASTMANLTSPATQDNDYWLRQGYGVTPGGQILGTDNKVIGTVQGGLYSAAQDAVANNGSSTANMTTTQLWDYLNGLTASTPSVTQDTLTKQAQAREAALRQQAESQKGQVQQQIAQAQQEAKDVGGRSMGTMRRILARGGGLSGTAAANALVTQDNVLAGNINKLENQKVQLFNQIDANLASGIATNNEQLTNALISLEKEQNDLRQQQFNNFINYMQLQNQQKQLEKESGFTLSPGETRYDAQGNIIAQGAEKATASTVQLSPGETLYDTNTGQVLYKAPDKPSANEPTTKVIGDSLLQWNPESGTWSEVYKGAANEKLTTLYRNDPTTGRLLKIVKDAQGNEISVESVKSPVQAIKGQVVYADDESPAKLTDTQATFLSQGLTLQDLATEVSEGLSRLGTGAIKGWVTQEGKLVPILQDKIKEENYDLLQKIYALNNLFVYFSTGKQLNESEFDRLGNQLPNIKATTEYNQTAIKNFTKNINTRLNNYMKVNGWKFAGTENEEDAYSTFLDSLGKALNQSLDVGASSQYKETYDLFKGNNYSDQEIIDYIKKSSGFNTVGGDTNKATGAISIGSPLATRLNNPGNLKYIGQSGAVADASGFAKFSSPQAGWNALINDIKAKQTTKGKLGLGPEATLAQLINVYAPPSENDTATYIKQMEQWTGYSRNTKLKDIDTIKLARAIAKKESSTTIA